MKKTVIVFGTIAGIIVSSAMIFGMAKCYDTSKFEGNMVLGYSSMIVAFSFVFIGIKNYRDKYNEGAITFGKAFLTGLYIALIASTFYVITWLIDYHFFIPDFMDKYAAHMIEQAKASGATAAEVAAKTEQMNGYKEMYKSPIMIVLFTYFEILPLGILVTLISALILKRKNKSETEVVVNQ